MALNGSRKSLKLISAVGMTVFSVVASFTASFAWFTAKRNFNGGGTSIDIQDPKLVESYCMRNFAEGVTLADGTLAFSTDDSKNTTQLGNYSVLIGGYQRVFEVNITGYAASLPSMILKAITETDYYLADVNPELNENNEHELLHPIEPTDNPLSSVVNFTYFTEDDISFIDATNKYFTIDTKNWGKTTSSFVTGEPGSRTLQQTSILSLNVSHPTNNHFFILLDYDVIQINEIYAANLGNPYCSGEIEFIQYEPDFHFVLSENKLSSNEGSNA